MKKTFTVNVDHVDPEFQSICKPEMTSDEIGVLGMIVLKYKVSRLKQKILGVFKR